MMYYRYFFHLQFEEHIDSFQFGEIMNETTTHNHVWNFVWT